MLPADHRLRRREDFALAVRRGRRSGSELLVAHVLTSAAMTTEPMTRPSTSSEGHQPTPPPARVGFVVSKAVGGAVVRTRVKRRLRALVAARMPLLPAGALVVVRANAAAADASSAELGRCLDRVLSRVLVAPVGSV